MLLILGGSLGGVGRPHKFLSGAEALVPEGHGSVDDVLSISTHHHKPVDMATA